MIMAWIFKPWEYEYEILCNIWWIKIKTVLCCILKNKRIKKMKIDKKIIKSNSQQKYDKSI